ncbi:uncharacterized protein LOC118347939 isoform X2 [Juglans regia]|uniref:Fumarylacetoacetase n=1 Tax=Juglans regia TaxID=51240 RepID=A0A6P9EJP3_JUGRE|nr:uncharacterized protein LOC118347939 isoform X2 [Juglans regia]
MALKSFIEVHPDFHFPIQNLPYGVFRVARYSGLTGRGDRGLRSGFFRDRLFRALRWPNPEELRLLLSATDIQAWEYVPLSPFLGKSFGKKMKFYYSNFQNSSGKLEGTTISP